MLAFEEYSVQEAGRVPERQQVTVRRVAGAVLHVAEIVLSAVAVSAPPHYTSEHFGHAEKRNDPKPDVNPVG